MSAPAVAVLDIGSNSIKILVARREPDGRVVSLQNRTIDARISAGIGKAEPRLSEDGMTRGLDAIRELLADAAPFLPAATVLVATSAVRDARNGTDFRQRVLAATGHPIRILTGDEEANLIGRGLTCDPELAGLRDFHVFDLGGGSLECLTFKDRLIRQSLSLQLGCVRLTEKFVADPAAPFPAETSVAIAAHVRAELARAGFRFDLPAPPAAVFTGGSMTAIRLLRAAREGRALADTSPVVTVAELDASLAQISPLTLDERLRLPGLPAGRADVFPAALATMRAVAEAGQVDAFRHSLHNLRWGLAAKTLENF